MAAEQDKREATEWRCGRWDGLLCLFHCSLALVLSVLSTLAGAELLVEQLDPGATAPEKDNPNMFLVGASWQRLLSGAEDVGLFKEYSDGSMRGFTCTNKHNFKDFKGIIE